MRNHSLSTLAAAMFAASLAAGCGGSDKATPAGSASAMASAAPTTPASAAPAPTPAAPTPSAAPSAAPSAEADADDEAKPGAVHVHLASAKVMNGKEPDAEKKLKGLMLKLRTKCVVPAIKKKEAIDGSIKVIMEVEKDGKVKKAISKVATGKVPESVGKCVEEFYEKNVDFDGKGKAKVEATIEMGDKVKTDK